MDLIQLENEIKLLLKFRLAKFEYDIAIVEAYEAMDETTICRIELFKEECLIEMRVAKYEAQVKEGFYYEAESKLIQQLSNKLPQNSISTRKTIKSRNKLIYSA